MEPGPQGKDVEGTRATGEGSGGDQGHMGAWGGDKATIGPLLRLLGEHGEGTRATGGT